MKRHALISVIGLGLLALATGAFAQVNPRDAGNAAIVEQAKQDLERAGANLTGPCGAERIVELAAWRMRDAGAGLLFKNAGNQCNERATDIIVFPGALMFDVLVDGGGANRATWQDKSPAETDIAGFRDIVTRYRAAQDPHFDTPVVVPPVVEPPAPPVVEPPPPVVEPPPPVVEPVPTEPVPPIVTPAPEMRPLPLPLPKESKIGQWLYYVVAGAVYIIYVIGKGH